MLSSSNLQLLGRLALVAVITTSVIWSIPAVTLPTSEEIAQGNTKQTMVFAGDLLGHPTILSFLVRYPQERDKLVRHLADGLTVAEPWFDDRRLLFDLLSDEQTFLLLSRNTWLMELLARALQTDRSIVTKLLADRTLLNQVLRWVSGHGEYRVDLFGYPQLLLVLKNRGLFQGVLESWVEIVAPAPRSLLPPRTTILAQTYSPYAVEQMQLRWLGWNQNGTILETTAPSTDPSGRASISASWRTDTLQDGLYIIEASATLQHKGKINDYVPVYLSRFNLTFNLSTYAQSFETRPEEGTLTIPSSIVDFPLVGPEPSPNISQHVRQARGTYEGSTVEGMVDMEGNATISDGGSSAHVHGDFTLYGAAAGQTFTGRFHVRLSSQGLEGDLSATGFDAYSTIILAGRLYASLQELLEGMEKGSVNLHFSGSIYANEIILPRSSAHAPAILHLALAKGTHVELRTDNNATDGLLEITVHGSPINITVRAYGQVGEYLAIGSVRGEIIESGKPAILQLQSTPIQTLAIQIGGLSQVTVTLDGQAT